MEPWDIIVEWRKAILGALDEDVIGHQTAIHMLMAKCLYDANEARQIINRELCGND
jgi:hypothetical protein